MKKGMVCGAHVSRTGCSPGPGLEAGEEKAGGSCCSALSPLQTPGCVKPGRCTGAVLTSPGVLSDFKKGTEQSSLRFAVCISRILNFYEDFFLNYIFS